MIFFPCVVGLVSVQTLPRAVRATLPDGRLDPKTVALEAEYELKPHQRLLGCLYFAGMGTAIAYTPEFIRLLLIQYVSFSFFEYCFHRWCMHAPRGTPFDKLFARWNRLHLQHHLDTKTDMTMEATYNYKGIRFNYLTTRLSVVIGCLISFGVCFVAGLPSPLVPTLVAASLVSLYHSVLWNRLHVDSHSLEGMEFHDGIQYLKQVPTNNRYAHWLLTNHIGHHAVKGKGNFNIVFPGPDHLAGTFFRVKS